jgi:hypothetical protein
MSRQAIGISELSDERSFNRALAVEAINGWA